MTENSEYEDNYEENFEEEENLENPIIEQKKKIQITYLAFFV